MKRKMKWGASILVLLGAVITVFLYIQSHPGADKPSSFNPMMNEIKMQATQENITKTIEVKGKSSYVKETVIYAPFSAEVMAWHVQEGQSVKSGDVLFELDADKMESDLSLAEARILQQQLELNLSRKPSDTQSGTVGSEVAAFERFAEKERSDVAERLKKIELEAARKELADKQDRFTERRYAAPETGIFLFADRKEPMNVDQDKAIGIIVDLSELQLNCEVSEFEVFRIKEDMEVEVRIDALQNEKLKGRVLRVSKFAKAGTGSNGSAVFEVTIELERHPALIAGLSLTGKIITDSREDAVVVPTLAVLREGDGYFVYAEGPSGVEKRQIHIGIETADKTEVLEGLSAGDTVVLR